MRILLGIIIFVAALIGLAVFRGQKEVSRPLAELCVEHSGGLRAHYHPSLKIIIGGKAENLSANIGVTSNCMRPVHTHDASGKIHVETPDNRDVYLRDFFAIWKEPFGREEIMGNRIDETHRIRMMVADQESQDFENLLLKDGQEITIYYEEMPISSPARGED